jgi:thymidylate synthase
MINIEDEYRGLLSAVLYRGAEKPDRTGTGTRAVFGRMLRHDMELGFPILTSKKIYFGKAVTELLWILSGSTDLAYLHNNNVKYWDADYKRSGRTDGTLGPVYGKQWRNFGGVDQLYNLLREIKKQPHSRRLVVNAWNPIDLDDMVLPPCHYGFQVYINNGEMSLMWQQRSADIFLGLPYDIVMYGLLLEMLAAGNGYKPKQLICSLGDCHLYNNHVNAAKVQLERTTFELPQLDISFGLTLREGAGNFIHIPSKNMIKLNNYKYHEPIKAKLST